MLPPSEKFPVVLLQWSEKSLSEENEGKIVPMVKKEIEKGGLVLLPNTARDSLLLTATQQALEVQAEFDELVKERTIRVDDPLPKGTSPSETGNTNSTIKSNGEEVIMDYFTVANKESFCQLFDLKGRPNSNVDMSNRDSYGLFTAHERSHLVMGILEQISVRDSRLLNLLKDGDDSSNISNLKYLLQAHEWIDVLTPLHIDDQKLDVKKVTWWPLWQVMPPIHKIQDYYGPAVAYYFAFMGFLSRWIAVLGLAGTGTAIFRMYRGDTVDEDEYTPFYGLVCFIWSILFLKFWERKEKFLAYDWGTLPITNVVDADNTKGESYYKPHYLHRRPEFYGTTRISPVTGKPELYYPNYKRKLHYIVSAIVTAFMLGLAFFIMILSLNLQGYIVPRKSYHPFHFPAFAILSVEGGLFDANSTLCCYIPVVLHAVCILTLNTIYRQIARKLTDWENHITQTEHDNSMILKRFLFEAFDCYVALFYLAFFERDIDRLRMELIAVFYIDVARRVGVEVVLPIILHYREEKDNEHPHDLHLDEYEPFDDYMEILISCGYVTLFASAYPFASMVMFFSLWVEIRSDCYKLCFLCQKPAGERVSSIGMWKPMLEFMIWFSCLTNCLIFGFTSDQMMHYLPQFYIRDEEGDTYLHDQGWLAILAIFGIERILLYFGLALHAMIPTMPESLSVKLQRRQFLLAQEKKKSKSD